jgi:putative transposase
LLFSPKLQAKPGPKGSSPDLIRAVVEMKRRNPRWGCPRIAEQIALVFGTSINVFGTSINKDVVRRILAAHYQPSADGAGTSWLTFLGHVKDSLHSIDLFRCESVVLRTYWVLVVMDQCIRLVGFGIHAGTVDGLTLCPHVLPGGSRTTNSEISQFGSRSALSNSSGIALTPVSPAKHLNLQRSIRAPT